MPAPSKPRDAESIRARVLADPNTAKIAKELHVRLEDYVAQVVHYAMNPDEEPEVVAAEDEDLKAVGFEVPDEDAMGQYLIDSVNAVAAVEESKFQAPQKKAVDLVDSRTAPDASGADANLAESLKKQLRGTGKKG